LILVGDILELSEADEDETYSNAKAFLIPLIERVNLGRIVYIPGNHDHHLWVELLAAERITKLLYDYERRFALEIPYYVKRSETEEEPGLYKLVSKRPDSDDEGDYSRAILKECHKRIGKV